MHAQEKGAQFPKIVAQERRNYFLAPREEQGGGGVGGGGGGGGVGWGGGGGGVGGVGGGGGGGGVFEGVGVGGVLGLFFVWWGGLSPSLFPFFSKNRGGPLRNPTARQSRAPDLYKRRGGPS